MVKLARWGAVGVSVLLFMYALTVSLPSALTGLVAGVLITVAFVVDPGGN